MSKMSSTNPPYDAQASTNYREAFQLFDKRGTQRVQLDQLGDLLRACGQNPTLNEIRELEKNVGGECESILFIVVSWVRGWFLDFDILRITVVECRELWGFFSTSNYGVYTNTIFSQSISKPSPRFSTDQVDSATQVNQRNTVVVSRSSIRT